MLTEKEVLEIACGEALKVLNWMVPDAVARHNTHGNPGNYSPELQHAIDTKKVLEEL